MRVVGVEGTAWCASAAVFETADLSDSDAGTVTIESEAYRPAEGGIHPREAAEHMREAIPGVVGRALDAADGPVDAVAFSRGPGLGPCLRITATAARSLAGALDVPLVGVNHMVAHLEVGRHYAGFETPVCLNASGANAHVLGFHDGRYRVLGETMDTGVGNALDKFTRHLGWSHPGGPKIESHAEGGEYLDLPYVVKGMDFSFSGITSAAQDAVDDGADVSDVCFSLQETMFGMLTEVSERALGLTGRDELVLGGGVGQNDRLREMLAAMCEQRGAEFYAPDPRFLRDNAGMIAILGAKMYATGDTLDVEDSAVDPDFRPDEVPVTWRSEGASVLAPAGEADVQGAEALVSFADGRARKRREAKTYRHEALDDRLRRDRTVLEARLTSDARRVGVPTPVVFDVDVPEHAIEFESVGDADLRDAITESRVRAVTRHLAAIHDAGFVHGDPTTRNVRIQAASETPPNGRALSETRREANPAGSPKERALSETRREDGERGGTTRERVYLIDFGLGYYTDDVEDYAMDLHVFRQSLAGTADDSDPLLDAAVDAYADAGDDAVLDQLAAIEGRGRYRSPN